MRGVAKTEPKGTRSSYLTGMLLWRQHRILLRVSMVPYEFACQSNTRIASKGRLNGKMQIRYSLGSNFEPNQGVRMTIEPQTC
jgi:hypothetical protein